MTRKRYIKLLMGKLDLSRNEARENARAVMRTKAYADQSNHRTKYWGGNARRPQISYEVEYEATIILNRQKEIIKFRRWLAEND